MALDRFTGNVTDVRILGRNYWGRLMLRMDDGDEAPVVGSMLGIAIGDAVEVSGAWVNHERFGRQIKAKTVTAVRPRTETGTIHWLAARLPNVGRKRAQEMISRFGGVDSFWQVLEHEPERLTEVPGLTEARVAKLVDAYQEHRATRDRDIRLRNLGLTESQIGRLTAAWGEGDIVEQKLRDDPYQVIGEIRGFGWSRADAIARAAGVPENAPSRIIAAIGYAMDVAAGGGHTYLPVEKLLQYASNKILRGVKPQEVRALLPAAESAGLLRVGSDLAVHPVFGTEEVEIADLVTTHTTRKKPENEA